MMAVQPKTYISDTNDHVTDVGLEGVDSASLLVATEPNADADECTIALLGSLLQHLEFACDMGEVSADFTSLALDTNFSCIHSCNNWIKQKIQVRRQLTKISHASTYHHLESGSSPQ